MSQFSRFTEDASVSFARGHLHIRGNDGSYDDIRLHEEDVSAELVYLQGGDRRQGDRGSFPELGLVAYQHDEGHMAIIKDESVQLRPFSDWMTKS